MLQTGDGDYAWNLQVEDEVLTRLERGGRGRVLVTPTALVEQILLNLSDPWREVDGERSSPKAPHPILGDPLVRRALGLLIDRSTIATELYGRFGSPTGNILDGPAAFVSPHTRWAFNPAGAEQALEAAGWRRGPDGVRIKEGRRLRLLFQTSTNPVRQKTQAVVKQACARAGIEIEMKAVLASVFFSSDAADGYARFHADLQMYNAGPPPDPLRFMERFTSWRIPSKATDWSGGNVTRWRDDGYDALWRAARTELDPARRAALFMRMNDLVVASGAVIPVVQRARVEAVRATSSSRSRPGSLRCGVSRPGTAGRRPGAASDSDDPKRRHRAAEMMPERRTVHSGVPGGRAGLGGGPRTGASRRGNPSALPRLRMIGRQRATLLT